MNETTTTTKCPGCGAQVPPVDQCLRCGWRLSMRLFERWAAAQRQQASPATFTEGGAMTPTPP